MLNGFKINEDIDVVIEILSKLKLDPHCPCRINKTNENICMCKEFREQKSGECHCGLFIKE